MTSAVKENYHEECEALVNQQINMELYASYAYLYMGFYFEKENVSLPGLAKFFKKSSDEERQHAQLFMKYQTDRGGNIVLHSIAAPKQEFAAALDALETALALEKDVNRSLLAMAAKAGEVDDPHLANFLDEHFLDEQVQSIKELADMITRLKRAGATGLGEYMFDKELQ